MVANCLWDHESVVLVFVYETNIQVNDRGVCRDNTLFSFLHDINRPQVNTWVTPLCVNSFIYVSDVTISRTVHYGIQQLLCRHAKSNMVIFTTCRMRKRDTTYRKALKHYTDVIMTEGASQITSLTVVYSAVYSGWDQRKHQSSAVLAFVRGIHRDRWIPRAKGQ